MSDDRPIGVLVGGASGLGVVARLRATLPKEDLLVISDDSHDPYAALPARLVRARLERLGTELTDGGAKLVLLGSLQGTLDGAPALSVPVLTLDGSVEEAARRSTTGVVAAVCGEGCVRGDAYTQQVRRLRGGISVVVQEWAGLRSGILEPKAVLERALASGAGAIALVCGHASPLAPTLREAGSLLVVDAPFGAADRVRRRLAAGNALAQRRRSGRTILSSSAPARSQAELAVAVGSAALQGR